MDAMLELLQHAWTLFRRDERGAIGWLVVGIIVGVLLVVFGIIKFVIPGD